MIYPTACGRLVLGGNTVEDQDAGTASYIEYLPYKGDTITLYDGAEWIEVVFANPSVSVVGEAAGQNYDVFCYLSGGAPALEILQWTNDTTRATALTRQDGVLVKSGDATRLFLGTIRTSDSSEVADQTYQRLIWNMYNRLVRTLYSSSNWAVTHSYTTSAWRSWNNDTTLGLARYECVIGQPQTAFCDYTVYVQCGGGVYFSTNISGSGRLPGSRARAGSGITSTRSKAVLLPEGYSSFQLEENGQAAGSTSWQSMWQVATLEF